MLRVGLTGGIASGKSAVARMFEALGAGLVDTDRIARAVVAPGEPGLAAVRAAFGEAVMGRAGELDRRALRTIVFGDPAERRRLEAILHPLIRERALAELERLEAPYAIVVVPLLVETGFAPLVDRVLVVDCPVETQLERLIERDGMTRAAAQAMIDAQAARSARLAAADDVIDNGGDLGATRDQVRALDRRYRSLERVCRAPPGRAE